MFDLFFGDKVTIFMTNDRYHAVVVWTANFLLLMLACTRFSHG